MDQIHNSLKVLKNKVLIIEDELSIAELIQLNLSDVYFSQFNLQIFKADSCENARTLLPEHTFDLIILDWMLPKEQGIDFLKSIKKSNSENANASFLFLTAKVDSESIVNALESGADDYVTKPFDFQILKARVKNILSRKNNLNPLNLESAEVQLNGLIMNFEKVSVILNQEIIHCTPSEFKLLGFLIKSQGRVLTRDQLIDLIQGQDVSVTGRTIDTHIFSLRKKLGHWSQYIETIRGVGYRIITE